MTRLEWAKAHRRDRQRLEKLRKSSERAQSKRRQNDDVRQETLRAFAHDHGINCFVCGGRDDKRWAKSGWNKRGPWIICVTCVARNRRENGLPENTPAR